MTPTRDDHTIWPSAQTDPSQSPPSDGAISCWQATRPIGAVTMPARPTSGNPHTERAEVHRGDSRGSTRRLEPLLTACGELWRFPHVPAHVATPASLYDFLRSEHTARARCAVKRRGGAAPRLPSRCPRRLSRAGRCPKRPRFGPYMYGRTFSRAVFGRTEPIAARSQAGRATPVT